MKKILFVMGILAIVYAIMVYAEVGTVNNRILIPETTVPTAIADHAQIWTESDNSLHFQDGAGVDHDLPLSAGATTLDTYDAVVAASGGDYTTILTACATEAAGARIFVSSGTYTPSGDIVMKDGQMLIGQNPEDTIIDFSAADRQLTYTGTPTNLYVEGFTLQNSIATYMVHLLGNYARVDNCRLVGSAAGFEGIHLNGQRGLITRTVFTGFARAGFYCVRLENFGSVIGCFFNTSQNGVFADPGCSLVGNTFISMTANQAILQGTNLATGNMFHGGSDLIVSGAASIIAGNYFDAGSDIEWDGAWDSITITGNHFTGADINCDQAGVQNVTISGNTFIGGAGISIAGQNFAVNGNTFQGAAFINLTSDGKYCSIVGNSLEGSTAGSVILDAGVANTAYANAGVPTLQEKAFFKMDNTSGGALAAGDIVVFKAVAAGDEVTTTTNQGDDLIFGMADESINSATEGFVQTLGKTTKLKVDGTIDIAIGDFIGTFTTVKIGMKAAAGDMVFAIALEAYPTDDSAGVIDAILITPRKI